MPVTVWLGATTLGYPQGGGHLWVSLNWALSLRAAGCDVVWLEAADPKLPAAELHELVADLRRRLAPYGFDDVVALCPLHAKPIATNTVDGCIPLDAARQADLEGFSL